MIPFRSPGGPDPAGKDLGGLGPNVASSALAGRAVTARTTGVSLIHAFNGISDLDSANVNGGVGFGDVTPPDQGLCVGFDHSLAGAPKVVFETVNDAVNEYLPNGTLLKGYPVSVTSVFLNGFSDPRCLYDPKTASFYFTEIGVIGSGPDAGFSADDVTVLNARGVAQYQFDSSESGNCLGDQPKVGFDNNALVISTDQYCGSSQTEVGAQVLVISKSQLVHEDTTVNFAQSADVSLGGIPVVGLDPAINTGTGTSYLVNSFAFTAAGNNNALSKSLGLWKLTNDRSVTTGTGLPTLTGKVIGSEQYAFPVPAASTGDGSVNTNFITSEAYLNPDDSRLSGPVNVTTDDGVVSLWTALDSAVNVGGSPVAVDGAAWFKINTSTQKVSSQGYVAQKGANLLYPALLAPASGPAAMVFTVTSPTINPSPAYTTLGSGKVTIVATGSGPHISFSDYYFNQARWGDYSWAGIDPGTNGIWMATEYIPPTLDQDPFDNWGTFVFKLSK